MSDHIASERDALRLAAEIVGGQAAIAAVCGFSDRRHVWPWFNTGRRVPIEHCPAIEKATNGAVCRWHLRQDDWHRIWPELIGIEGAPPVPDQKAA
jgi:DNA-binding transcriptional regulator YdaS (Cro superfamily)